MLQTTKSKSLKYIFIAIAIMLGSCGNKLEIIYEIKNNETHQKATLSLNPADLGGGDVYYVDIIGENENVVRSDFNTKVLIIDHYNSVLPRDTSKIKIWWHQKDTLKIAFEQKLRIYNQVIKTRDNVIIYEDIESSELKKTLSEKR